MDLLMGLQVLWTIRSWRNRDRWTRSQMEAHQAHSLHRLREQAYRSSPFYQRFHDGMESRPLYELPVLTKAMVMEHFDELVTDRSIRLADVESHLATLRGDDRYLGRYWVNATSGTTGRRGLFLFGRSEWATVLASFARGHEWAGRPVGIAHRMRLAEISSTVPWHMSARAGATLSSPWAPTLRIDASEPVDAIVDKLNGWQPEMLVAYPSIARVVAEEQQVGRLRIQPELLFTSGELLTGETRRRIEGVWNRRVFNQYAATECGGLAAECTEHRGLHLFEDLVIVEVVDSDNRPVPPGVFGDKLLITVLFSQTQPLIRYELSDSLKLASGACSCGRPFALIEEIQGRTEEVLSLSTPDGGTATVQPGLFHRLMDAVPSEGWQVVQKPEELEVLVAGARADFDGEALAESLRLGLAAQGIQVPPVAVRRVQAIPRGATGKAPLIRSELHQMARPRQ